MNRRKLVVSTGNQHKVQEIKRILRGLDIEVLSKNELDIEDFVVIEDGETLSENSIKKAKALANRTEYIVLADDSGIFVNALNGEPGVYSSRYSGEEGNDKKNNQKLLENLKDKDDRNASFRTVIALITEDKKIFTVQGICKGNIGLEPKGSNGFGYDSIFIPDGYEYTFAQLGEEIKNKISHRAKALAELKTILKKILEV